MLSAQEKTNVSDSKVPQKNVEETKKETVKKENAKAPGQGFEEKDFAPKIGEDSYGWLLFQVVLILGLLAGGFYYFYRFVSKKAGFQASGQDVVQTLSAVPMGPGRYLYIIDVAGKVFMLGVTDNNINLITEIEDKDEKDRIRLLSSKSTVDHGKSFGDLFSENIGKLFDKIDGIRKTRKAPGTRKKFSEYIDEDELDVEYLKSQKSRLKKMNGNDEE